MPKPKFNFMKMLADRKKGEDDDKAGAKKPGFAARKDADDGKKPKRKKRAPFYPKGK